MHTIAAFALMIFSAIPVQKPSEPAKKPTELDRLVKTKSIDKLRAKFLQAANDDARDEIRAAIMTVVSEVFGDCSKAHRTKTKSTLPLDWPDHEHRGYIDLNKSYGRHYRTVYGKHLPEFSGGDPKRFPGTYQAGFEYQLIIVAGELKVTSPIRDCVLICDRIETFISISESVVVAASSIKLGHLSRGLAVTDGRADVNSDTDQPIYTRDDIFMIQYELGAQEFVKSGKGKGSYYAEGKIADTGLTFFHLADLGIACKLDADKAVVVESVKAGSPAKGGKLKAGDILNLVNSRPVKDLKKVEELFRYAMMDSPKAKVTVTRGKQSLDLEILFP